MLHALASDLVAASADGTDKRPLFPMKTSSVGVSVSSRKHRYSSPRQQSSIDDENWADELPDPATMTEEVGFVKTFSVGPVFTAKHVIKRHEPDVHMQ